MSNVFFDLGYHNPENNLPSRLNENPKKNPQRRTSPGHTHRVPEFSPLSPETRAIGLAGVRACREFLSSKPSPENTSPSTLRGDIKVEFLQGWEKLPDGAWFNKEAGYGERNGEIIPPPPGYDR